METKIGDVKISITHSKLDHSSFTGLNIQGGAAAPDDNAEILRELQSVRERLAKTEPMIAKAVADLEKAVKANDKTAIAEQLANFASGAAKGVIAGVASKALLSWMGIA